MKTKYGFPIKSAYTVAEISENLLINVGPLQNYLYKKGKDAKKNTVYSGDELMAILVDYSKEAHLRKGETIERSKYLINRLTQKEGDKVVENDLPLVSPPPIDSPEEEDVVEETIEEVFNSPLVESGVAFDEEILLKIINLVSMLSALIGIYLELKLLGVISLGAITCLFLVYALYILKNEDQPRDRRGLAVFMMFLVEGFWCVFHIKTFESFNSEGAVFGQSTALVTSCVIGVLSFVALLIQSIKKD